MDRFTISLDEDLATVFTTADVLPGRKIWRYPPALLPILMICGAFVVDLNTPNGLLDGYLYVAAVLVCVWVPVANAAFYTALGLMFPMVLGFVLSPNGAALEVAVANRSVAMGTIWLAALAVWSNARARESTLTALRQQQQTAERTVHEERVALSDWLGQEISVELAMVDWRLNHLLSRARRDELRTEALVLRRAVQRAHQSLNGKAIRLRAARPDQQPRLQAAALGAGSGPLLSATMQVDLSSGCAAIDFGA